MCKIISPYLIFFIVFFQLPLMAETQSTENNLLLTGQIKAGDVQNFTVPWSQNWRQQIKWMMPEGEIAEEGDLVVLYDTESLNSQIEQEKVSLRQAQDNAKNNQLDLEQKLIDAEHQVIKAELEFKLAKLIADVPANFRSELEQDNIKFDLKKSSQTLEQSKINLSTAQKSLIAEKQKESIETDKIRASLAKIENELELLQQKAQRKGAVLHATHPWDGSKIAEGQSVQTAWNVASIPGLGDESVQSWVNEVDWPKLKQDQLVKLTLDAYPLDHFSGKISKIGLQAESKKDWGKATYYDVEIQIISKPQQLLSPGMSVLIEVLPADNKALAQVASTTNLNNTTVN